MHNSPGPFYKELLLFLSWIYHATVLLVSNLRYEHNSVYLQDLCNKKTSTYSLHSGDSNELVVPCIKHNTLWGRAFYTGPYCGTHSLLESENHRLLLCLRVSENLSFWVSFLLSYNYFGSKLVNYLCVLLFPVLLWSMTEHANSSELYKDCNVIM